MLSSMAREPFYVTGRYSCPEMSVYAGWVAHPSSYAARHSCRHDDGLVTILAGECVGDTGEPEIAQLYRKDGPDLAPALNGLFSCLILDPRCRRGVLFNDRYGLERLYVHERGPELYFASEAGALLRVLPQLRSFDPVGLAQLLAFGTPLGSKTLFGGLENPGGGVLWSFDGNHVKRTRYFTPTQWETQPVLSGHEFDGAFAETFPRAVRRYLGGKEPLAVSLTGGLDTRMIMASLEAAPRPSQCYTFSGVNTFTIDEQLAASVAAASGLEHHVLRIGPEFFRNYALYVDSAVCASDGLAGGTAAHEVHLNALARSLAPIRLTGNFGSEILRSMSTFKALHLRTDFVAPDLAREVERVARAPFEPPQHPVTFAAFQEVPWKLFGTLAAGRSQVTFRTPYLDNDVVALAYQAPRLSRRSPDAALRFISGRDSVLGRIPTDRGVLASDSFLRGAARRALSEVGFKIDYLFQEGLPGQLIRGERVFDLLRAAGLLGRHKYLPYRLWFRRELADHVRQVAADHNTASLPLFKRESVETMVQDHIAARGNYVRELDMLLTIEAISRLFLRARSADRD